MNKAGELVWVTVFRAGGGYMERTDVLCQRMDDTILLPVPMTFGARLSDGRVEEHPTMDAARAAASTYAKP